MPSDKLLCPLLKRGLPLIGNLHKPFDKSVLIPLELTAAASTTDAAVHQKECFDEINDIMKTINLLNRIFNATSAFNKF